MERPSEEDQQQHVYVDSLEEEVGMEVEDVKSAMVERDTWCRMVEATHV